MNAPVHSRVVLGVLCIFLFIFSALPAQARNPADFEVILFENSGCEGENQLAFSYDNDLPNLNRFNIPGGEKWNDRVSSLAVGKNARAILYQHSDFRGPSISFEADGTGSLLIDDLHLLGWGDTVTSAKIRLRVVPAPDEVLIFEHVNFDGAMLSPSAGGNYPDLRQWTISGGKTWNDKISSLKIGKDALLCVYADIDFGGPSVVFSGDGQGTVEIISLHGTGWEDAVSSMKVRARGWTPESEDASGGSQGSEGTGETGGDQSEGSGQGSGTGGSGETSEGDGTEQGGEEETDPLENEIVFFKDADFQGEHRIYAVGENLPDLRQLSFWDSTGNWNDEISSLKIGANAQAYVCTHINYEGPCVQHRGNGTGVTRIDNLHRSGWGDRISSIKIREKDWNPEDDIPEPGADEVIFFEHVDYGGKHLVVKANRHELDLTKVFPENSNTSWNDKISSIKVGSSVKAEIYEHINPGSNTRPIHTYPAGSRVPTLHSFGWGDRISAIRVLDDLGN